MKIFCKNEEFGGEKVNFVDDNGVILGYDLRQCCCEQADWNISENSYTDPRVIVSGSSYIPEEYDYSDYRFSLDYFVENDNNQNEEYSAQFKLEAKDKPNLYLTLVNCHNGYYAHGFRFKQGNTILREGSL